MMKKGTLILKLLEKFPTIELFDHSEFGISAESGSTDSKGWPLGDYYDAAYVDPEEKHHMFGISRELWDFVVSTGWTMEWINPGMIGLYPA